MWKFLIIGVVGVAIVTGVIIVRKSRNHGNEEAVGYAEPTAEEA